MSNTSSTFGSTRKPPKLVLTTASPKHLLFASNLPLLNMATTVTDSDKTHITTSIDHLRPVPDMSSNVPSHKSGSTESLLEPKRLAILKANLTPMTSRPTKSTDSIRISISLSKPKLSPLSCLLNPKYIVDDRQRNH